MKRPPLPFPFSMPNCQPFMLTLFDVILIILNYWYKSSPCLILCQRNKCIYCPCCLVWNPWEGILQ